MRRGSVVEHARESRQGPLREVGRGLEVSFVGEQTVRECYMSVEDFGEVVRLVERRMLALAAPPRLHGLYEA